MFSTRFGRGSRREKKTGGAPGETGQAPALPKGLKDHFTEHDLPPGYMQASFAFWQDMRQQAGLPPVNAIDPTRLPRECLPHMALLEVQSSPLRFRTRLAGTRVVEALGIDHTGCYLDEIAGMTEQIERITWCACERRPYLSEARVSSAPNDYKHCNVLTLPFGDNAVGVQRIVFVFSFPESPAGNAG